MIACFDVQYLKDNASIAAVVFHAWEDAKPFKIFTKLKKGIAAYEPGKFYLRELPCLLEILDEIDLPLTNLVIDGYVFLSDDHKSGLGHYLYNALDKKIPIIGVAKNGFKDLTICQEIFRGDSQKPLFITSIGIDTEKAADCIRNMHGNYRIPTLLKLVDATCRKGVSRISPFK